MTITDYFQVYANLHLGEYHSTKEIVDEILKMSGNEFVRSSIMPQDYATEDGSTRTAPLHDKLFFKRIAHGEYLVTAP